MVIHARTALLAEGWAENVRLTLRGDTIARIEVGVPAFRDDAQTDVLLPALANLHSHAFQRAMAGMTERRQAGRDSFWTWRDLMYRFLRYLTPEDVRVIAGLAFMEMQEAGYASVGEFHYVHHQPDGRPYDRLAEFSCAIFDAAQETGIGLTHLPVLYTYGGVAREPLADGQLRFANDLDRFLRLVDDCADRARQMPGDTVLGVAPHSLRAVAPEDLARLLKVRPHGPVHIHIAEQVLEVKAVESRYGQRPVEWLLSNNGVDARWCLIHATHMTETETRAFAQTRAVAGICPITEANLGDGTFNGPIFLASGGRLGIGSDSNIRIALGEELRSLEYSQRLRDRTRNVLADGETSVGRTLYTAAARGGAQALARRSGVIAGGCLADLVAIDRKNPALCALRDDQLLDGLCFAAGEGLVTDLWSAGRHQVRDGRHVSRDRLIGDYRRMMDRIVPQL